MSNTLGTLVQMKKHILWIDDNREHRETGLRMVSDMASYTCTTVPGSGEAETVLKSERVDCIVTDIFRRERDGAVAGDDGYAFFTDFIRLRFPEMQVVFHTKNLPGSFQTDEHSWYLPKWDEEAIKAVSLEQLIGKFNIYDSSAHFPIWKMIEPRLIKIQTDILGSLRNPDEIWTMPPDQFEQLVSELLQKMGFRVLWLPGGRDQGIDIVAVADDLEFIQPFLLPVADGDQVGVVRTRVVDDEDLLDFLLELLGNPVDDPRQGVGRVVGRDENGDLRPLVLRRPDR